MIHPPSPLFCSEVRELGEWRKGQDWMFQHYNHLVDSAGNQPQSAGYLVHGKSTQWTIIRQADLSRDSPDWNTEVGLHALLQVIFWPRD